MSPSSLLRQLLVLVAIPVLATGVVLWASRPADQGLDRLWPALAVGLVVAALLAWRAAADLRGQLDALTALARDLLEGRYERRVRSRRRDELGALARALDEARLAIRRRDAVQQRAEAQLRAMLAGMVEGVIAIDDHDRVLFQNRAAERLLGLPAARPGRTRMWELTRSVDLARLVERVRASREEATDELEVHVEGRERVLAAHVTPFAGGGVAGFVIVLEDVTDFRRLEQQRREFVANVSHELKTPLTSIQGYVETLLDGAAEDPRHRDRFLRRVQANAGRLHDLVQDLLQLARAESEEATLEAAAMDLRAVAVEALPRWEARAREKGIRLRLHCPEEPVEVVADAAAMALVLDNLLDNAIKYTPGEGEVRVHVRTTDAAASLVVEDTGVGVPARDLDRIFERFYRVDKARSRAVGGTGLGLSIVKHLVQNQGGEVRVESRLGEGSRFLVELPRLGAGAAPNDAAGA